MFQIIEKSVFDQLAHPPTFGGFYHFLPGMKITFRTAIVPAVDGVTPEIILTPSLASIRAWLVVPVIYYPSQQTSQSC